MQADRSDELRSGRSLTRLLPCPGPHGPWNHSHPSAIPVPRTRVGVHGDEPSVGVTRHDAWISCLVLRQKQKATCAKERCCGAVTQHLPPWSLLCCAAARAPAAACCAWALRGIKVRALGVLSADVVSYRETASCRHDGLPPGPPADLSTSPVCPCNLDLVHPGLGGVSAPPPLPSSPSAPPHRRLVAPCIPERTQSSSAAHAGKIDGVELHRGWTMAQKAQPTPRAHPNATQSPVTISQPPRPQSAVSWVLRCGYKALFGRLGRSFIGAPDQAQASCQHL